MKETLSNLLSVLGMLAVVAAAVVATLMAWPLIQSVGGSLSVLLLVVVAMWVFGLICAIYLRILRFVAPLDSGSFPAGHANLAVWKHAAAVRLLALHALTPFFPVFLRGLMYRLFGARIGSQVIIGGVLGDPELTEIGEGAVLGHNSCVVAHAINADRITLQPVRIGRGATVGIHAVVMPGVEIGDGAVVAPGAVVTMNTHVPAGEFWGGIPARRLRPGGEEAGASAPAVWPGLIREPAAVPVCVPRGGH